MTDPSLSNNTKGNAANLRQQIASSTTFYLSRNAARLSGLIRMILDLDEVTNRSKVQLVMALTKDDDNCHGKDSYKIPIYFVKPTCLAKVVEFLVHYEIEPMNDLQANSLPSAVDGIDNMVTQEWYLNFCNELRRNDTMASALLKAADYMEIPPLAELLRVALRVQQIHKKAGPRN